MEQESDESSSYMDWESSENEADSGLTEEEEEIEEEEADGDQSEASYFSESEEEEEDAHDEAESYDSVSMDYHPRDDSSESEDEEDDASDGAESGTSANMDDSGRQEKVDDFEYESPDNFDGMRELLLLENNNREDGDTFELFRTDEDYLKRFGSAIAKTSFVEVIILFGIKDEEISPDSLEALRKGFAESKSISGLHFQGGGIVFSDGSIFQALVQPLQIPQDSCVVGCSIKHKLDILSLESIKINAEATKKLSIALSEKMALKSLVLEKFSEYNTSNEWKILSTSFQSPNMTLIELDIVDRFLENSGFIEFSAGLAKNTSLRNLMIGFTPLIGDMGWAAFGYALSKSNVKFLILDNNDLDHDKVAALASGLAKSQKLTKLWILGRQQISGGGIRKLADVLANPLSNLKKLSISSCRTTDDDVAILSKALYSNNTLESLRLDVHGAPSELNHFSQDVLCNTSSIGNTYHSNHMLKKIHGVKRIPTDVRHYLKLNRNTNKEFVAVKKVFDCHLSGNFQLHPFKNIGTKLLVLVLGWVGTRSRDDDPIDVVTRLSAFYRLLKSDPALFVVPE